MYIMKLKYKVSKWCCKTVSGFAYHVQTSRKNKQQLGKTSNKQPKQSIMVNSETTKEWANNKKTSSPKSQVVWLCLRYHHFLLRQPNATSSAVATYLERTFEFKITDKTLKKIQKNSYSGVPAISPARTLRLLTFSHWLESPFKLFGSR
jgi:hypothetical protein